MMELHERLYSLGEAFGSQVFDDPDSFRGALDDYLDEGAASTGDINLLADAVRLGAFRRMREMLANGATPMAAVDAAGELLSRERGSADVAGSRWACAVLGYATGDISGADVRQYRTSPSDLQDIRGTNTRPTTPSDDFSLPGSATAGAGSWPGDATAGSGSPPRSSTAGAGAPPAPEWPTLEPERPPRPRRRASLIGIVVGALLLSGLIAVVAVLATRSSDSAGDKPSQGASASTQSTQPSSKSTAAARRLAQLSRVSYDGDPLSDVAIQQYEGLPADIQVMRSNGHALVPSPTPWARLGVPVGPSIHRLNGDFNGDQKTDMAVIEPDGDSEQVSVLLSSGSSFGPRTWQQDIPEMQQEDDYPISGDFNGDGKMDLAIVGVRVGVSFRVMTSTGSGFNAPRDWDGHLDDETIRVRVVPGDMNNDGKTDLVIVRTRGGVTQVGVLFSEGSRFGALHTFAELPVDYLINDRSTPVKPIVGDFNGDHKTDLLVYGQPPSGGAQAHFLAGTGSGLSANPEPWWTNAERSWNAGSSWMSAGDFDGDGLSDVARIAWMPADQAVGVWVLRSDGHQLVDGGVWGKWQAPGVDDIGQVRTVNRVG